MKDDYEEPSGNGVIVIIILLILYMIVKVLT